MAIELLPFDQTQKNNQETDALKAKHRVKFASWRTKQNIYFISEL